MNEIVTVRDIEMVTSDIRYAQRQGARQLLSNLIEIGRLLVEAKSMVAHGEWGKYLEEKVDYSQSTANNLMKLYQEYGSDQESFFGSFANSQAFGKLSYTQALALLALPTEERQEFAENHDPEATSSRDWEKAVREREAELKEAKKRQEVAEETARKATEAMKAQVSEQERLKKAAEDAQAAKIDADGKVDKLKTQLAKAKENEKAAKVALENAKAHPEIPESLMEEMRQQVAAEAAAKATEDLKKQLSAAQEQAAKAEKERQAAEEKAVEAQKAVQMANPDMVLVRTHLQGVQDQFGKLIDALRNIKKADPETGAKMQANVGAKLIESMKQALEAV